MSTICSVDVSLEIAIDMNENEVFENHYFVFNKKLLMIMCIWPYQRRSLKLFVRTFVVVVIHTMMIPQMIKTYEELHEKDKNIEILVENIAGFFYFQGVLSKLYMSIYTEKKHIFKNHKLQHLYEHMTKDYKEIQEPGDRAAMIELWNFARILSIVYTFYMSLACIFFVFTPVALPATLDMVLPLNESRTKIICYYAEYYIDQQKYLYYLLLHTFVGVAFTLLIIASVDTSFIAVAYHVLGLFNLLNYRLKLLCEHINDGIYREDQLHDYMVDIIKIHKKTIECKNNLRTLLARNPSMFNKHALIKAVQDDNEIHFYHSLAETVRITYNECFFFITGMVLLVLSIGTMDLVMNLQNPSNLIRIGFVFVGLIGYMFFTNWPGQRFLDSSEDLLDSIYFCNWYKLPVKTQFLVKFMMMRCSIPCQLTAGPLLQMNFTNCGLVLRTAMSYFTAIASLN